MRRHVFFLPGVILTMACGSSGPSSTESGPPEDGGNGDSGIRDAGGKKDTGTGMETSIEASVVPCGSITCPADQFCVMPTSCGGADTGVPCTNTAPPLCARLPSACDTPSATCSCIGESPAQMSICEEDGGGGQCAEIDDSTRTVTCLSQ
jgi:hypothetical protein